MDDPPNGDPFSLTLGTFAHALRFAGPRMTDTQRTSGGTVGLVLAAGLGTRMRSSTPKVLHEVCGRPMLDWVVEALRGADADRIVCVVREVAGLEQFASDHGIDLVQQVEGEGTGAAVLAAADVLRDADAVIVHSGDQPLVTAETLGALVAAHEQEGAIASVLVASMDDPGAYGRVIRDADGGFERIVETKNRSGVPADVLAVKEINVGSYVFEAGPLLDALAAVDLVDGERFLPGVLPILREQRRIAVHAMDDAAEAQGVNNRRDLIEVERHARRRIIQQHALNGVSFPNPDSVVVDVHVEIGEDTVVEPGCVLRGSTEIGSGCTIGPNSTLIDAELGNNVTAIQAYITTALVGDDVSIGPFAYIRPGTRIANGAKIGSFVEVKNSNVGEGTKIPHLSYIGDADIGAGANIAAGNITANYHAGKKQKSRTTIGDGVKTGVDTMFVAPVDVGDGAYTAAGSVITEDVPPGALAVARPEQKNVEGYAERLEKKDGDGKP